MATTTTTATTTAEKRREVFIEKGYVNDEPNQFASINGKNFLLPKGETSEVPEYLAAEIERSRRAQRRQDKNSEKLLEKTKQPIEYR